MVTAKLNRCLCLVCDSIWRAAMPSGSYQVSIVLSVIKRLVTCLVNTFVGSC